MHEGFVGRGGCGLALWDGWGTEVDVGGREGKSGGTGDELELKLVRCETTRCRGTEDKRGASVVATRARWRVDSNSSRSRSEFGEEEVEVGVRGNVGDGGIITGNVFGGFEDDDDGWVLEAEGVGIWRGRPEAARAFTTASQPFSRVLILSRNSSFSFSLAFSRSLCSLVVISEEVGS